MKDHLNSIQKLCTNLDPDAELVAGSIYGLRQWLLGSSNNTLFGHNQHIWDPAVDHEATCTKNRNLISIPSAVTSSDVDRLGIRAAVSKMVQQVESLVVQYPTAMSIRYWPVDFDYRFTPEMSKQEISDFAEKLIPEIQEHGSRPLVDIRVPVEPHSIASPKCTCGFYAYTDMESLAENSDVSTRKYVFGIIEAWGLITEGTKGFRAEKARIVGLTRPMSPSWSWEIESQFDGYNGLTAIQPVRHTTWSPSGELLSVPSHISRFEDMDELMQGYEELKR